MNKKNNFSQIKLNFGLAALLLAASAGGSMFFALSPRPSFAAEKARVSPHETIKAVVDGNQLTLDNVGKQHPSS